MTAYVTLQLPPVGTKITRAHLAAQHPVAGIDTIAGPPGADGHTPVKGVDYFDGDPGLASTVPGPQGEPGLPGAASTVPGPPGIQGPPGSSGAGIFFVDL